MRSKDEVEIVEKHFNAPHALDKRFKRALKKSDFLTESGFFRFHMMQFVSDFESKEKATYPLAPNESKAKKKVKEGFSK